MSDNYNGLTQVFVLEHRMQGEEIRIPMERSETSQLRAIRLTILKIIEPGLEPLVGCLRTEEGATKGPYLRFLGSVATRETFEDDPENVVIGQIVGGYHLVLADANNSSRTYLLPGRVDTEQTVSVRKSKVKSKRD